MIVRWAPRACGGFFIGFAIFSGHYWALSAAALMLGLSTLLTAEPDIPKAPVGAHWNKARKEWVFPEVGLLAIPEYETVRRWAETLPTAQMVDCLENYEQVYWALYTEVKSTPQTGQAIDHAIRT